MIRPDDYPQVGPVHMPTFEAFLPSFKGQDDGKKVEAVPQYVPPVRKSEDLPLSEHDTHETYGG